MADPIDPKSERRAEAWGYSCRQAGHARGSNPYADVPAQTESEKELIYALAAAWWRGWDQGDTTLKGR
jgi:hypothetical protein